MALEIVAALEEVVGSTVVYWTLVEPGGIMNIIDVASKVLNLSPTK